MAYLLGVVLFAAALFVAVCLHEAGHMLTAKHYGMKVTRYFAGFGPTLWSFRRGETEYGLKAIPLGGFVKIVGMTPQDDDAQDPKAMWRFPVWKRTVVMGAGSVTHFILGFLLLWFTLGVIGIPNPVLANPAKLPGYVTVDNCVPANADRIKCQATDAPSPAKLAGLRTGDRIVSLNGVAVSNYEQLVRAIRQAKPGPTPVTYLRDGVETSTTVNLVTASRRPIDNANGPASTVPALGVSSADPPGVPATVTYGPVQSLGQATKATGQTFAAVGSALKALPSRIPKLLDAIGGKPRDPNTPVSVVGASRLGGETVAHHAWFLFFSFAASINIFFGVFNLLPLLPLDGGHIAIAWYEKLRSIIYRRRGRADPGRVDYMKLMPLTYAVILIFGAMTLLAVTADIVNPVTIFQ